MKTLALIVIALGVTLPANATTRGPQSFPPNSIVKQSCDQGCMRQCRATGITAGNCKSRCGC